MRLSAALLVLWMALIGAVSPALGCTTASGRDCCPADAPVDCRVASSFEHADGTATAVAQAPSLEPFAPPPASFDLPPAAYGHFVISVAPASEFRFDAALTYLRTGRLRL